MKDRFTTLATVGVLLSFLIFALIVVRVDRTLSALDRAAQRLEKAAEATEDTMRSAKKRYIDSDK